MGSGTAETRHSYDVVAARYAAEVAGELPGKPLDRALLTMMIELADDGLIADIGCGPGHVTDFLMQRGGRVIGVDLSPAMCALSSRESTAAFVAASMTALPVRSGALSAIVSLHAVIHLDDAQRPAAYREFARSDAAVEHPSRRCYLLVRRPADPVEVAGE